MTFGQDIQAALPRLRAYAESRMVDTVLIERCTGTVDDETTGHKVKVWETVYDGPCRWQQRSQQVARTNSAGGTVTVQTTELHLPVLASGDVTPDEVDMSDPAAVNASLWRATATVCVNDPARQGIIRPITADMTKTDATARRLLCAEV